MQTLSKISLKIGSMIRLVFASFFNIPPSLSKKCRCTPSFLIFCIVSSANVVWVFATLMNLSVNHLVDIIIYKKIKIFRLILFISNSFFSQITFFFNIKSGIFNQYVFLRIYKIFIKFIQFIFG